MPSFRLSFASLCLVVAAAGCGKKETPEYRLTTEQLAWQPYQVGDVLRFGQAHTSKVRTFAITEVSDQIVEHCNSCGGPINLWPVGSSKLQEIRVDMLRTDTARYVRTSGSTTQPDSIPLTRGDIFLAIGVNDNYGGGPVAVQSRVFWDFSFYNELPVQEAISGQSISDTTAHLLPSLQVGGTTYGPVIQLSNNAYTPAPLPRTKPIRRLYYARAMGVVAFVEGNTVWYRLP